MKKQAYEAFGGESRQESESSSKETNKVFSKEEGEYVSFEEVE